jgi:hypothetical protein
VSTGCTLPGAGGGPLGAAGAVAPPRPHAASAAHNVNKQDHLSNEAAARRLCNMGVPVAKAGECT